MDLASATAITRLVSLQQQQHHQLQHRKQPKTTLWLPYCSTPAVATTSQLIEETISLTAEGKAEGNRDSRNNK